MSHFLIHPGKSGSRSLSIPSPRRIKPTTPLAAQANEGPFSLQDLASNTRNSTPQAATLVNAASSEKWHWHSFQAVAAEDMKASSVQREDAPLLLDDEREDDGLPDGFHDEDEALPPPPVYAISNWQLAGLYTTHTLSMWNNRSYEFAAVLFITSAYPHTLTIASLRGLTANLASVLFSPAVGSWCNRHSSRLLPLQVCIVLQRVCICVGCVGWMMIVRTEGAAQRNGEEGRMRSEIDPIWQKHAILAGLLVLGMLEKLSWVGNLVVMERDWVPILATDSTRPALHVLNANVKRIDLISKLVAPLAVSGIVLWLKNLRIVALIIAIMQGVTVGPEIITAWRVWKSAPALQSPKQTEEISPPPDRPSLTKKLNLWTDHIRRYVHSPVFIPSLAWTIQPLSVLTLSASMMVYLLSINFPLEQITIGRTLSTGVEIFSTIVTPILISWLRRRRRRTHDTPGKKSHHLQPLITVGLLGLGWQLCTLIPAVVSLFILPTLPTNPNSPSDPTKIFPITTKVLLISLGLSRLGPFAYALVEQQLVQVAIPPDRRLEFSGTEMALFSLAELCRWAFTAVFGRPEQFKGVAVVCFGAIVMAAGLFWWWTRRWKVRLSIVDEGRDDGGEDRGNE